MRDIIAEGLTIWARDNAGARVEEVMTAVGLDAGSAGDRRPHQFSGGQCQRICIARSLALDPEVLICDEPVSALDVSVQAQILNLLEDMKARYHLTMVFIAHNLAVVKNISDRASSAKSAIPTPFTRNLRTRIPGRYWHRSRTRIRWPVSRH